MSLTFNLINFYWTSDWAAKITGLCSKETTLDGKPYYQDATWTTSLSRHVVDPSW